MPKTLPPQVVPPKMYTKEAKTINETRELIFPCKRGRDARAQNRRSKLHSAMQEKCETATMLFPHEGKEVYWHGTVIIPLSSSLLPRDPSSINPVGMRTRRLGQSTGEQPQNSSSPAERCHLRNGDSRTASKSKTGYLLSLNREGG